MTDASEKFKKFVRERIIKLLQEKNLSEYQLSLGLGHSKNYIQNITSGKAMPSLEELGNIIDYFQITPAEFFGQDEPDPLNVIELHKLSRRLSGENLRVLIYLAKSLAEDE